ncbi:MAG: glycine--tRNA ligase subunit beta [Firmicutes bacterium]|nr:glycine--tRNA ligase subunit beta [Bacillota bacterium]
MSKDFLLEIGVEELPARFLEPALEQLKEMAKNVLTGKRLAFGAINTYGTPRRIALFVENLAEKQEPLEQEIKGPAVKVAFTPEGRPAKAAEGFARSQGVALADLLIKKVGQVEYVFALKREEGRVTEEVLAEIAPGFIAGLHFPKPMRWGSLDVRFARPIRWLLALYGPEVVAFEYAGLSAGRITYGHRFLVKEPLVVANARDYIARMREGYVMVDPAARKAEIWRQVQDLAASAGGFVEKDEELLNEVNNLVEYPTALMGEFSPDYLKLPRDVLVTPMREHQRYFPVSGKDGTLLNKFIAVKNGTTDHLDIVRAGNEKVLRARLADAGFFYQEDLKETLAAKVQALKKIVFQESLGTVYDKVVRVSGLAGYLADLMGAGAGEKKRVLRAAYLAKADLVTNMVYEFPELQGIMGKEYALKSGENEAVAEAIFEHYLPRFAGDMLPATLPGKILSIADKIDNIAGCFAIGIQPTGSQDPYALRRQALGIIHILLEGGIDLSLGDLVNRAYDGYEGKVTLKAGRPAVVEEVAEFFRLRLRGVFIDEGYAYDTVDAVLAAGYDNPNDTRKRVQALAGFRREGSFEALHTAFVRANNLSRNADFTGVDPEFFTDPAEEALYRALDGVRKKASGLLQAKEYRSLLAEIAALRGPLENFFNGVLVMAGDEKVRANRLALLKNLVLLVNHVADLSKIVMEA